MLFTKEWTCEKINKCEIKEVGAHRQLVADMINAQYTPVAPSQVLKVIILLRMFFRCQSAYSWKKAEVY